MSELNVTLRHLTQSKKCQPHGGSRRKVKDHIKVALLENRECLNIVNAINVFQSESGWYAGSCC